MLFALVKVLCLRGERLLAGRLIGGSCDVISHSAPAPSGVQSDVVCVLLSRTALIDFLVGWLTGLVSWVNSLLSMSMCCLVLSTVIFLVKSSIEVTRGIRYYYWTNLSSQIIPLNEGSCTYA